MVTQPLIAFGLAMLAATPAVAAPLPPAPVIGAEKDADGRPLPFGRQTRLPPETPAASGPHKAIMTTADGLPAHVIYHPANLAGAGKLPIVAWGNGACINAGNRFRYFLTEIASHGYLVLANGVMANPALEVGPQENPPVRPPGSPPPPPPPPRDPNAPQRAPGTTTPQQLIESIDWAIAENSRPGSPLFGRIDTAHVAVMGQSCGGVQAMRVAADPRISTMVIWNSGVGMIPGNPADPAAVLASVHTPIAFIHGDAQTDVAFYASEANARALAKVPVFQAWQNSMTHLGTYGQANGGFFGTLAVAWLDWQLKGSKVASRLFVGADCSLCQDQSWHVFQARLK